VSVNDVLVGVACEPLRRLWVLFGDRFELSLLATSTRWSDAVYEEDEDEEEDHSGESAIVEVTSERDVASAVETLTELITDRAVPYAERYASIGSLLGEFRDDEDPDQVDLRVPALLAAAGRFDEAGAALDRYEPPEESDPFSRRERRTAYQLRRWVAGRGDEALLPADPPPSRFEDDWRRRSFAQLRADSRAQREAVEEVQQAGRGRDRHEVRAMLEAALARRGVSDSPLWIEPRLFGIALVDAWLKPEPAASDPDKIGVYVGEKRVGVIPDDAVPAYQPAMKAARFRGELPCLNATLARVGQPRGYVLELALPPT
jgi:hypothetical protein